jgi:glycosyltransferase involved in cell wall biosynthesis
MHVAQCAIDIKTEKKLVIAGGSSDSDEYVNSLHELAKDDPRIMFTGFVQGLVYHTFEIPLQKMGNSHTTQMDKSKTVLL